MLFLTLAACEWGTPAPPDPVPHEGESPPPPMVAPALPPPARVGVAEVPTPAEIVRATALADASAPGFVDVWFDADRVDAATLGTWLDGWGLPRMDGDGASWRVAAPEGGEGVVPRLLGVPGVADARVAVTQGTLPSGRVREGSERYGDLVHTWSLGDGGPSQAVSGGAAVPGPIVPGGLPPGGQACLRPVVEDMEIGISAGVGWERALSTKPRGWAVVLEDFGPCRARGWLLLRKDAPVASVTFGGRAVAEADEAFLQEQAIGWLGSRRSEFDPLVMSTVAYLSEAPDAVLARAVRDVAPSPVQAQLLEAFAARNPEGALALAGGATSPTLRAAAIGQDEELRRAVIEDLSAPASAVYAALAIWRPGPKDAAEMLDRFLASRDPGVRARAWQAKSEATDGLCRHRLAGASELNALAAVYADCPQLDVRDGVLDKVRVLDPARADGLLARTLEAPETEAAGVAAVAAARKAGRLDLLVAVVGRTTVSRNVRAFALAELEKARAPEFPALDQTHGAYLGMAATAEGAPATAQDDE